MTNPRRPGLPAGLVLLLLVTLVAPRDGEARRSKLAPYQEVKPFSFDEKEALRGLKGDLKLFRRGAALFNHTITHLIERSYLNEKALLEKRFRTTLEEASRSAQSRRLEAIKEYEAFIKRHASDQIWTPDVLMRLAELYYEKAEVDYRYSDKQYNQRLLEIERIQKLTNKQITPPSKPIKDYTSSLFYYREILRRFPKYKNRDLVTYVLGYVLRLAAQEVEAADDDALRGKSRLYHNQARQAFLGLVCSNKFKALTPPGAMASPAGYNVDLTQPAVTPGLRPFEGFVPYNDCRSAVDLTRYKGAELKKRRWLLSQSWFLVGEEHFDADPPVALTPGEKEKLRQEATRQPGSNADKQAFYKNRWYESLNEKKLRKLRLHNYYAISAYTQVARRFRDSKEFNSALYKRAWTYFKIDRYKKALSEFDFLLTRAKEKDLKDNATRYVALCAFYQRESQDPFAWLRNYYTTKDWINDQGQLKYPHVKAAFHQLAEVLWEEAAPPPDSPGAQFYDHEKLEQALGIYQWILSKGGFKADARDSGNPDGDWKYYLGKAPIQVRILRILGLLSVNEQLAVRKKYPQKFMYSERKRAFDRFSTYGTHQAFATVYERKHGANKEVANALMVLREDSLLAMGQDFFNLGGQYLAAYGKYTGMLTKLKAEQKELETLIDKKGRGWRKARRKLKKVAHKIAVLTAEAAAAKKAYQGYFAQANKAFRAIVSSPKHKNTLTAYKAQFYMGLAAYYAGQFLEATRIFRAVQYSKISVRRSKEALKWRLFSFQEVVGKLKLPPDPDPSKPCTPKPVPGLLTEYHQLLREVIAADPKNADSLAYQYSIAAHYFRYCQIHQAKKYFTAVMKKFPKSRQAFYAENNLLTMVQMDKKGGPDDDGILLRLEYRTLSIMKSWCPAKKKISCEPKDKDCPPFVKTVGKRCEELAKVPKEILRTRAFKAFKNKKYALAAVYFQQIIKKVPNSKEIALFLYNAAFCYEKLKRFRKAKQTYESIVNTPKYRDQAKTHVIKKKDGSKQKGFLEEVIEYLALNALKALDYETGRKYFKRLASEPAFAAKDGRVSWYYQYAYISRIYRDYDVAVRFYRKYVGEAKRKLGTWYGKSSSAKTPKEREKFKTMVEEAKRFIPRADLEIGRIREKQGRWREMIASYLSYVAQIEYILNTKRNSIASAEFWLKNIKDWRLARDMMDLLGKVLRRYRKQGANYRQIRKVEDRILNNFKLYSMPPLTKAASSAAAIAFDRVKHHLAAFKKHKWKYRYCRFGKRWTLYNVTKKAAKKKIYIICGRDLVADAYGKLNAELKRVVQIYTDARDQYRDDLWYIAYQAHIGKLYETAAQLVSDPKLPTVPATFVKKFKKRFADPFEFEEKVKSNVFGSPSVLETANQNWDKLARLGYRAAVNRAKSAGIDNEWTRKVRRWLARIHPANPYINEPKIEGGP